MNEIKQLIKTLKHRLKVQSMTYRDLAQALSLSEASVKRLFASERLTLERLIQISHLLGFTLAELTQEAALDERRLHTLSEAQEKELVSDEKLLLVAVCALNQWKIADMTHYYQLSELECVGYLLKLDRLKLLQLLPGNRIRLNVARDFDWHPRGPIRTYFAKQGLDDFLNNDFTQDDEAMALCHAMLSDSALAKMQIEIRKLRQKFAELHEESLPLPLAQRHGTALLLAIRRWELPSFTRLRKTSTAMQNAV